MDTNERRVTLDSKPDKTISIPSAILVMCVDPENGKYMAVSGNDIKIRSKGTSADDAIVSLLKQHYGLKIEVA